MKKIHGKECHAYALWLLFQMYVLEGQHPIPQSDCKKAYEDAGLPSAYTKQALAELSRMGFAQQYSIGSWKLTDKGRGYVESFEDVDMEDFDFIKKHIYSLHAFFYAKFTGGYNVKDLCKLLGLAANTVRVKVIKPLRNAGSLAGIAEAHNKPATWQVSGPFEVYDKSHDDTSDPHLPALFPSELEDLKKLRDSPGVYTCEDVKRWHFHVYRRKNLVVRVSGGGWSLTKRGVAVLAYQLEKLKSQEGSFENITVKLTPRPTPSAPPKKSTPPKKVRKIITFDDQGRTVERPVADVKAPAHYLNNYGVDLKPDESTPDQFMGSLDPVHTKMLLLLASANNVEPSVYLGDLLSTLIEEAYEKSSAEEYLGLQAQLENLESEFGCFLQANAESVNQALTN